MKKILTITMILIMLVMLGTTTVKAVTSATLADEIYEKGKEYGITASDKVKIERYLTENPVTEEEAEQIMSKVEEAKKIMVDLNAKNYDDLTKEQKNQLKDIAVSVAEIIDVKLVFKQGAVDIYNNEGKLIETITENNGKLAYTGNGVNIVLVVSVIAVIALAITVVTKRVINAK